MAKADEDECDCGHWSHSEDCPALAEPEFGEDLQGNDVFIVEGHQERYGSNDAWVVSQS